MNKAVATFDLALTELIRDNAPALWATVQNNLGSAYRTLGEHRLSIDMFSKAIDAYEAALTERTREKSGYDWAMTQDNLGYARLMRGLGRHSEAEVLEGRKAVESARDMLLASGYREYESYFIDRLKMFDTAVELLKKMPQ